MTPFLEKTAKHLFEKYSSKTDSLTIILPNRRASLYLKKYLANHFDKPFWSPKFYSIEDFINQIANKTSTNSIYLINELYKIHLEINTENCRNFDEFIGIAELLLTDFNEIDLYLVDADKIFDYLSETKAIEQWSLDGKPLTVFQQNFLSFYKSLKLYYFELKKRISNLSIAYQGYNYRYVAENIENMDFIKKPSEIYIFLGFNALTPSEEKIINYFRENFNTEIICDIDKYYFDNQNQEAGLFLRKLKSNRFIDESSLFIEDNFRKSSKNIELIGVPMKIGQAKFTNEIIKKFYTNEQNLESTAIVLCDENMQLPLMKSLPENIEKFNVTMGLSLKHTAIFDLFDSILLLHENHQRFFIIGNKSKTLLYSDLLKIFKHNYFKRAFDIQKIVDYISKSNQVFYSFDEISNLFAEFYSEKQFLIEILNPNLTTKELIKSILSFINCLKESEQILKDDLNDEFLYRFSLVFHQILQNIDLESSFINSKVLRKLFKNISNSETIPFYGEPLSGLQVMGVLETRLLDFKNIIILSVNEGIIPKSHKHNSLIPISIKRDFGIVANVEKDAVFAYHFYRLIQRAENIKILYNTEPDEFSGGDKSRFVYQISFELPKINPNIIINNYILNILDSERNSVSNISIEKNDEIFEKLNSLKNNGFSATLLNDYIYCSLKFFFKYIAKIKIQEITEENIKENTKGSIIHSTLKELYLPYVGKNLTPYDIDAMIKKLPTTLNSVFDNLYKGGSINYGLNFLIYELINSWIKNFLIIEKTTLINLNKQNKQLTILNLENEFKESISFKLNTQYEIFNLKGNIDRIDAIDNCLRIIDYKSGVIKNIDLQISEISKITDSKNNKYAFQLLFYHLLLKNKIPQFPDYHKESGIISLLKPSEGFIKLKVNNKEVEPKDINEFEEILKNLLSDIFDEKIPFIQTTEEENCKYCDYKEICIRTQFNEN